MDLHSERLNIVSAVGSPCEVREVKLNLVPPFVQTHWHRADERLHPGCALVVRGSKSPTHVLVIKDLHFEGEVLLQVLDDHDKEGQLYSECLLRVSRCGNKGC